MERAITTQSREDLGVDGTDEDRILRYAQRISENRQRHASIRSFLDPTLQLAVTLPDQPLRPGQPAPSAFGPGDTSSTAAAPRFGRPPVDDTSHGTLVADEAWRTRELLNDHLKRVLADPPEHLLRALGAAPQERVARERWERQVRQRDALHNKPPNGKLPLRCHRVARLPPTGQAPPRPRPPHGAEAAPPSGGRRGINWRR